MSAVENPAPAKKTRRPRRLPLHVLAAKLGRSPTAIEQAPDGTVRLIFGDGTTPTQNEWDRVA